MASVGAGVGQAQDDESSDVRLVENGFCAGSTWVTLLPGEILSRDVGPDFYVYRVRGPGDREWGAYSGFAGQSRPDRRHALVTKQGASVYRGTDSRGNFNGYFVDDERQQNHFFASFFTDQASDAEFFERVELGGPAKLKCERYWADD